MSCQEWELRLAQDEISREVEAHLDECPSCRALATELRANVEAMSALRDEEIAVPVLSVRPAFHAWRWAAAVAALLVVGVGGWHAWRPQLVSPSKVSVAEERAAIEPPRVEPALPPVVARTRRSVPRPSRAGEGAHAPAEEPTEPLMVKMLTADPDVVIYWLIEPKEKEGLI